MSNPQISVIVPVYNVEKYLYHCIDSILAQTFTDFELLLIDDGSTDSSGKICDEYGEKDSRIRVFHKENGGVSSARNLGLDKANGEWIWFIDSDDYVEQETISSLPSYLQNNDYDCVIFGYFTENEHAKTEFASPKGLQLSVDYITALKWLYEPQYVPYQGYIWNKLFKRTILQNYHLRFDIQIKFNEDRLFCFEYLKSIKAQVIFDTQPFYHYIKNDNSAMASLNQRYNPDFITDLYAMQRMLEEAKCDRLKKIIPYARKAVMSSALWNINLMKRLSIVDKPRFFYLNKVLRNNFCLFDYTKSNRRMVLYIIKNIISYKLIKI